MTPLSKGEQWAADRYRELMLHPGGDYSTVMEFFDVAGSPKRLAFALAALGMVLSHWDEIEHQASKLVAEGEGA